MRTISRASGSSTRLRSPLDEPRVRPGDYGGHDGLSGADAPRDQPWDSPAQSGPRYWKATAGTRLSCAVLVGTVDGFAAVDLDSGAFVRVVHPAVNLRFKPLDVVEVTLSGPPDPPDQVRPEAVELLEDPLPAGQIRARRLSRLYDALLHPDQGHLLGFPGLSVPFWALKGDQPSMAVVIPEVGPQIRLTPGGFSCRFAWQGVVHELPLSDPALLSRLEEMGCPAWAGKDLTRLIGYACGHLLVMVSGPRGGYCDKEVAALLPS
ncbi:MAG: hypothetical protein ACT4OS_02095 [Acidimicrobiales bacterium]